MIIKLIKLEIDNVRDFDHLEINFGKEQINHITTLQMANGTGKTTTLTLLKSLFSGRELSTNEVLDYKPTLFNAEEGRASIEILINDEKYTVELLLNYNSGEYEYATISPCSNGHISGYRLPTKYNFSPGFIDLFIFNGELAESLLSENSNVAEIAISRLYGLSEIRSLLEDTSNLKIKFIEDSQSRIIKDQGMKIQTTKLTNLMKTEKKLNADLEEYKNELKELQNKYDNLSEEIKNLLNEETKTLLDKTTNEITETNNNIIGKTMKLRELSRNIMAISNNSRDNLFELKEKMDVLKLPKGTSSDFFNEICDSGTCICGKQLDDVTKKYIRENSIKYLSDDMYGVMNSIKLSISNQSTTNIEYNNVKNEIDQLRVNLINLKHKKDNIIEQLGGTDIEKTIHEKTLELNEIEKDLFDIQTIIDGINDEYSSNPKESIIACRKQIKQLQDNIGKGNSVIKFTKKYELLEKLLDNIYDCSMKLLKNKIINNTNTSLMNVLGKEITVDSIDSFIKLKGKTHGSVGQELSVGYVYLTSLFKDSEYELPFIIDSPCGSLDLQKRNRIAKLIPNLFKQVIFLVTSSERMSFTDVMMRYENINPYTIWKEDKNGTVTIASSCDLNIFNNYQSED